MQLAIAFPFTEDAFMAQKVQITLVDDLDGTSEADETVAFAIDGNAYEIDLSQANADKLRDALAIYVASARKASTRASRATGTSPRRARGGDNRVAEIRAWAKEQGLAVNERGRIPADIVAKYDAR
jgi:hypothetical protein